MEQKLTSSNQLPLPVPVQQAAASGGLGAFCKTYRATLARTITVIIIFLLAAGGFAVGDSLAHDLNIGARLLFLLLILLWVVASVYLLFQVIQAARRRIYRFQQGLVIEQGKQIHILSWRDIQVWQRITRRSSNGIYAGTTYLYTVRRVDGYRIELGSLVKQIAELGEAMTTGVTQAQVPLAFSAVQTGQTLTFGPFSVNQQGIGFKREFLPWQQMQDIVVSQGIVTVKKAESRSRPWQALVSAIPNIRVFLVLVEEMRQQAGRAS